MSFFGFLKNIFFLLIFIQFAPPLIENIQKQYKRYMLPRTKVGVVSMSGVLGKSASYTRALHSFFKDPEVKAILLKMECSGAAAGTGQSIQHEIVQLKQQYHKPVIVLVENMCASGGYYIASAADHIVASGCAVVGSIGVSIPYFFQLKKAIEQYNVSYIPFKAGKYKTATDPFVDVTEQDKAHLQGLLNDSYDQFTADVARNRSLSLLAVRSWADGQLFTGRQALHLGLIDEIGSTYNAIKAIKEKAIIEGEIEWVQSCEPSGFLGMICDVNDEHKDGFFGSIVQEMSALGSSLLQKITVVNAPHIA